VVRVPSLEADLKTFKQFLPRPVSSN
jgi:hypothetical protein